MLGLHTSALYALYLVAKGGGDAKTLVWSWLIGLYSGFGITAGAHRLWCHRSYKANLPLRIILAVAQTMAVQNDIFEWSRDHRVHHKFSETDADPHNSRRGFFFAHIGWLLCKKHPDVKIKGSSIDLSDLWADPVVRIQQRFYIPLTIIISGIIPVYLPVKLWGADLEFALFFNILRYVISLHSTWLVNSAAHMFGHRPYDKTIEPRENRSVVYLAIGEGYHNYHHTFPWDYSTSEFGWKDNFNPTTMLIDFFASIGWAYDLKTPSQEILENRKLRTGDDKKQKLDKIGFIKDTFFGILILTWPLLILLARKFGYLTK